MTVGRGRGGRRRFAGMAAASAMALLLAGAGDAPASVVPRYRYGSTFHQGFVWIRLPGRDLIAHAAGAYVQVPAVGRAAMSVRASQAVEGHFPNISSGCEAYDCTLTGKPGAAFDYPVRVRDDGDPVATVAGRTTGGYAGNLAFDLWLSAAPQLSSGPSNPGVCAPLRDLGAADTEVMIWLAHPGDYAVTSRRAYGVEIGGRRWHVDEWATPDGCPSGDYWRLVIFMAPRITNGRLAVRGLKLGDFTGYSDRMGWSSRREWLDSINLGWEMRAGGAGSAIDRYDLTGVR
jgi:hypothetical protein